MSSDNMQDCGHPIECQYYEDDDICPICGWCEEVDGLAKTVDDLTECLEKKAVVVKDGSTLELNCDSIGYLVIKDGSMLNMGDYQVC